MNLLKAVCVVYFLPGKSITPFYAFKIKFQIRFLSCQSVFSLNSDFTLRQLKQPHLPELIIQDGGSGHKQ